MRRCELPRREDWGCFWDRLLDDPAAAEDFVAFIEDGGVAGGDGALGSVEGDAEELAGLGGGGVGGEEFEESGGGLVDVADFDLGACGAGDAGDGDPVDSVDGEGGDVERGLGADGDLAGGLVDVEDVEGVGGGDAEALALADGEVVDAGVLAEWGTGGGDEGAGGIGEGQALLFEVVCDELLVVAAGDEADFLGVGLIGEGELTGARDVADLRLGEVTEGEEGVGELVLSEAEEEPGLVFGAVGGAGEDPAAADGVVVVAGVVAGGDVGCADLAGGDEELVELEVVIAEGARDGGASVEVVVDEGADTSCSKRSCWLTT